MDITKALAPKTDQIDATDLIGSPPQVFTIAAVSENNSELADQQPVNIRLVETSLWWRPSKGMLRVLADNWGKDVSKWVGRQVELYGDPEVYFGKEKRGGTRISRLSHIDSSKTTLINPRGGRGAYFTVKPLPTTAPPPTPDANPERTALLAQIKEAATTAGVELATIAAEWAESHGGQKIAEATDIGGLELVRDDLSGRASGATP